jgi:hypothetical protein
MLWVIVELVTRGAPSFVLIFELIRHRFGPALDFGRPLGLQFGKFDFIKPRVKAQWGFSAQFERAGLTVGPFLKSQQDLSNIGSLIGPTAYDGR